MASNLQVEELRDLSDTELEQKLDETYRQLFTTRLQLSTRQLANTSLQRKVRRRVARIKTVQRERELGALQQAAAESES